MPRHTVADSVHGQQMRIVVLAQKSSAVNALTRQLEGFNCAVEYAETLAEVQSSMAREMPHVAFIECLRFPTRVRDIAELFRHSGSTGPRRPRLVGIGCEHCCPSGDPRACGLDDYLRLPPDAEELEALLVPHYSDSGAPGGSANEFPLGRRELSVSEAVSQLPKDVQTAMLTAFVDYTATRLERIETGLQAYKLGRVDRDVHAVKSGCVQLGFTTMVECCEEMGRAIDAHDVDAARVCYRTLLAAFNAIAGELPRN